MLLDGFVFYDEGFVMSSKVFFIECNVLDFEFISKFDFLDDLYKRFWKYVLWKMICEFFFDYCIDIVVFLIYYVVLLVFFVFIVIFLFFGVVG